VAGLRLSLVWQKLRKWLRATGGLATQARPATKLGWTVVATITTIYGLSAIALVERLLGHGGHTVVTKVVADGHAETIRTMYASTRLPWAIAFAAIGLLAIVFLAGVQAQRELLNRVEKTTKLAIEVGDGPPWDLPDYQHRQTKLVGVRNTSTSVRAVGCHSLITGLEPIPAAGAWMNLSQRDRDLEPEETAFQAVSCPPGWPGTGRVKIQVWASNADHPVSRSFDVTYTDETPFPLFEEVPSKGK